MKQRALLKERKLLDLDILKKKYHIEKKHLLIPLFLVIIFLVNKNYFLFGLLTIFSGIFSFYHDKYNRTPIDFKMPLFLGIIITRQFGLPYTIIFFIISDFIPSLIAGGRVEATTIIFIAWYFIVNSMTLLFPGTDIILLGIILVLIEFFGSLMIKTFFGIPGLVAMASSVLSVFTRIVYFLTIGRFLEFVFQIL